MSATRSVRRQFTGLHMLAIMFAFFGVIISVNVTMAILANTSWTGFVVRNSYVAGLEFNRKAEEGRAQAALGWSSQLAIADGTLHFSLNDENGEAIRLSSGTATLRRPVSDAEDVTVTMQPAAGGALEASVDIRDGAWIVEISADDGRQVPWHEMERVIVRAGATR